MAVNVSPDCIAAARERVEYLTLLPHRVRDVDAHQVAIERQPADRNRSMRSGQDCVNEKSDVEASAKIAVNAFIKIAAIMQFLKDALEVDSGCQTFVSISDSQNVEGA